MMGYLLPVISFLITAAFFLIIAAFSLNRWSHLRRDFASAKQRFDDWHTDGFPDLTQDDREAYLLTLPDGTLVRVDTPPELVTPPIELPTRGSLANLLSVGLLGTFVGISTGLLGFRDVDLDKVASDPAELGALVEAVSGLLGGMTTAFLSTIFAIFAYLALVYRHGCLIGELESHRQRARDHLSSLAPLHSPLKVLAQLDTDTFRVAAESLASTANSLSSSAAVLKHSSTTFREAAEQLGRNATSLSEAARSLSSDAIGQAIGIQIRSAMQEILKPSFDAISRNLEVIPQLTNSIHSLDARVLPAMKESIDASKASSDAIRLSVKEASDASKASSDAIRLAIRESHEAMSLLGSQITTLSEANDSLVAVIRDDLGGATAALRTSMMEFESTTTGAMRRFRDEWEGAMSESLSSLGRVANQLNSLEQEYKRARSHMEEAMAVYEGKATAIDASIDRAIELVETSATVMQTFESLSQGVERTYASLESKTLGLQARFFDEAGGSIVELVEQLERVVRGVRDYEAQRPPVRPPPQTQGIRP